jgi:type I restriction enzyme, S subunit
VTRSPKKRRDIHPTNNDSTAWLQTRIGDFADLGSGSTPSRNEVPKYFDKGTVWWVKTGDLNNGLVTSTEERITQLAIEETSCRVYPAATLLVAMYGGFKQIGRTGLLAMPAAINQALTAISVAEDKADPVYLQHWLNANVRAWRRLAGSSRKDPNITKAEIAAFPVTLPPLAEQKAIAAVLSAWDRAIGETAALIAAKKRLKRGLMQQLLTGKRRLAGFTADWKVTSQ